MRYIRCMVLYIILGDMKARRRRNACKHYWTGLILRLCSFINIYYKHCLHAKLFICYLLAFIWVTLCQLNSDEKKLCNSVFELTTLRLTVLWQRREFLMGQFINFVFFVCRYSVIVQPGDSPKESSASKGETSSEAESMTSGESKPWWKKTSSASKYCCAILQPSQSFLWQNAAIFAVATGACFSKVPKCFCTH